MDASSAEAGLRRRIVAIAAIVTVATLMHHLDHVVRGEIVLTNNLDPEWNRSGWPFQDQVTPFTASLAIYLLLIGGMVFTLRGRLLAGYWLLPRSCSLPSCCSCTSSRVRPRRPRASSTGRMTAVAAIPSQGRSLCSTSPS